ncbi:uncharacterized protein ELE39_000244 [Cryptosporidium sp. chipmunk genotype I]|uniref:uncharacterized protein n=1 Tax=Cryptosporidium sp. chipmunk genotype I TaxID=1280935 RepID=UPI00351A97C8|nr:hypothetical protein ELE39_000244 [Cryptosporidium sp. chipmunk genotype I]
MVNYPDDILYSSKYEDDVYEYRHVTLPKAVSSYEIGTGLVQIFYYIRCLDLFQLVLPNIKIVVN